MKKLISALTICSMMLSMVPIGVNAAANHTMTVNEGQNIKTVTDSMYGLNADWAIGGVEDFVVDANNYDFSPNIELKSTFADTKLPVVRLGEGASQQVFWKDTIGDYASRPAYTLWDVTGSIDFGLVESIKFYQEIDPDVEFIITINMNDTSANAADLAEFLTGDKTTTWGSKRAECGLENPVRVKMYQLGNENDYIEPVMSKDEYVNKSKEIIDAVKAKDTDAVFGAVGGTALYTAYIRGEGYNDSWIKGVASALKDDLSYLTFNWYFKAGSAHQVNQLLDLVSASIKEATGSNRIKPCLTEFAESSYDQTVPYNLEGVLTTADFYIRSYNNTNIDTAVYHALNSSCWQTAWRRNGEWGLTGIGMLQNMLKKYAEGDVVESSLTGYSANESSDISAVALKPDADTLNLVFVNFSNAEKTINLELGEGYKLVAEDVLKSERSTPALTDVTDGGAQTIVSYSYLYADGKEINSYSLPAYSVCAMSFDKESNNSEIVFLEDFNDASLNYTLIQNAVDDGISATIANSKLVLDGYGDNGGTYENNYAYIPVTNSVDGNYTIKMDVTVNDIDAGSFGFVYGASDKVDLDKTGTGNIVLFTEEGVSESTYTNGSATICQNNTTNNAPSLAAGSKVNLQFDVNDTTVRVLADSQEIYSRQIDSAIDMANIGLMYSDISVSIDKISIIQQEKTIDINKPFIYENNFDDVENGELPAGFYKTAGNAKAYVENGALYIENDEWYTREGVLISDIGSVLSENAVIEADITMVSMDEAARAGGAANMGGIIFGANGQDKASVGLHTFNKAVQIRDKNGLKALPEISYTSEETPFHEGGTVALKVVCNKNTSPTIYINGNPLNYTKTDFDIGDTGYIGLYATASKIKIDNLKITGKQKCTYPEADIVTKTVDLNYAENFDGVSNGSLPFGWKLIDEAALAGSNETAVAKVENGALTFKATA
ncbi:MAG: hypothetical protein PUF72_08195, partial [Clostridiales bacterium]|nr:hypothetical protein [Clostridiales bacterium]